MFSVQSCQTFVLNSAQNWEVMSSLLLYPTKLSFHFISLSKTVELWVLNCEVIYLRLQMKLPSIFIHCFHSDGFKSRVAFRVVNTKFLNSFRCFVSIPMFFICLPAYFLFPSYYKLLEKLTHGYRRWQQKVIHKIIALHEFIRENSFVFCSLSVFKLFTGSCFLLKIIFNLILTSLIRI